MKTNILKYIFLLGFLVFLIACSTKRNSFLSRNTHALSTEYNILYNGGIALETGIIELKGTYFDNYWERLPVERMQPNEQEMDPGTEKNANFERAETKAIKAIQKHSMNIGGEEKNPQMDEAHLMLGKARYYDKRYVPALEAFNYVLYKYPQSDKIYEVKVWREKTNMRMENDALAVKNLTNLLKQIEFKDQIFADANAALAQAFLHLEQKDSAVVKLRLATEFTKRNEEKARYRFITAQLYEELELKDSAFIAYQDVIDMHRKSPRVYVIQAHARQAQQYDYAKGDTLAFVEKYEKLLKDRENRPFLDVLNHQMALFYDKRDKKAVAKKYYNKSLDAQSQDQYLNASNYRNLADIHFDDAEYVVAGKYFDSTLVHLKPRTREFNMIKKKRENLVDVIKYEGIATRNDSILKVIKMSAPARIAYYEDYIDKLKKEDALKLELAKKAQESEDTRSNAGINGSDDVASAAGSTGARKAPSRPDVAATAGSAATSKPGDFYFYNPTTVAYGKTEFRRNWGDRTYGNNWRTTQSGQNNQPATDAVDADAAIAEDLRASAQSTEVRYTTDFYLSKLPTAKTEIDSIGKERNFAYYQLGVIYKEKFKEYERAASRLEALLDHNPEERLVLPTLYNLYKIYQIIDQQKAGTMKNEIIAQYPDSRYAQILKSGETSALATLTPEAAYNNLYKVYEAGEYRQVLQTAEEAIDLFSAEEMVSKFELLKAHTVGKLSGVEEYKKALNYVALSYPNNDEGKTAERILSTDIPVLENLQFNETEPKSWKILYRAASAEDKGIKNLQQKIKKFIAERTSNQLTLSFDIYTMDANFVVIHGIQSEEGAKGIASVLKDFKEYKITETPIVISNDNYKVVQIKKNLEEYLADPKKPAVKRAPPIKKQVQDDQPKQEQTINPRAPKARTQTVPQSATPPSTQNMGPPGPPTDTKQPSKQQQKQPVQPVQQEIKKR